MENKIKKGCVYFFKHVGLNPIKIGYSDNESPFDRFKQFKTYAPFGAEIVGFVICEKPYEIEQYLHEKYIVNRLEGEWFDIEIELIKKEINNLTSKEQKDDFSDFMLKYAKVVKCRTEKLISNFSICKTDIFFNEKILSMSEILQLEPTINKNYIKDFFAENMVVYKNYKIGKLQKKGYKVYL